jgi:hypothetical protein
MTEGEIPRNVSQFIARYIDSVGQLEALLLLRAMPDEAWTAPRVAARLYIGEAEAVEMLGRLCREGLLVCTDGVYRFQCRTERLKLAVDELAQLYERQLIPVTNLIHAKSRRIREFANAFRFRNGS